MRTVLLVAAALAVMAAFWAIGDTFLIVFVGIFLALVLEYPVRFVMAKTRMSRGLAATLAGFILVPTLWAEEGAVAALIMLAVILVYEQVENNILTPKIQGKAVNLSAFFIIIVVTLFGALLGVLGALTAEANAALEVSATSI